MSAVAQHVELKARLLYSDSKALLVRSKRGKELASAFRCSEVWRTSLLRLRRVKSR